MLSGYTVDDLESLDFLSVSPSVTILASVATWKCCIFCKNSAGELKFRLLHKPSLAPTVIQTNSSSVREHTLLESG